MFDAISVISARSINVIDVINASVRLQFCSIYSSFRKYLTGTSFVSHTPFIER